MIETVIFDVGNVLCNFDDALSKLANLHSLELSDVYSHWIKHDPFICKGDLNPEGYYSLFLKDFNVERKISDFLVFWVSHLHSNIEVHKLVEELAPTYEIGIITNMYPNLFDIILEKDIIPNIQYSFIVKSCDIGYCKPDKEIYEYALELVRRKGDILFTDDGLLNLEVPKKMGWKTIHFNKEDVTKSVKAIKECLL